MKRTILSAALSITLAGTAAFAQQAAPPDAAQQTAPPPMHQHHHNPHHEAMKLSKQLNLTPDQTTRLEPILADRDQKIAAVRSNGQLTQQDARQQMRSILKDTHQQLAAVLSPDQLQQMKAMHHEHGPHNNPNQAPAAPPSGL